MKILVFDLKSSLGHFRRPDTLGTHHSYPFITRTALHGLIASILGLEALPGDPFIGIQLMAPVRTVAQEMKMLGKGWLGAGESNHRLTAIELVVKPWYRIYYAGELTDELEERLAANKSHYHTYLGSAYCLTFPRFIAAFDASGMSLEDGEITTVKTVIPAPLVDRLIPEEGRVYARVGGMVVQHLGGRVFSGSTAVIYERSGKPITFRISPDRKKKRLPVHFVRDAGDGLNLCLW